MKCQFCNSVYIEENIKFNNKNICFYCLSVLWIENLSEKEYEKHFGWNENFELGEGI